MRRIPTNRHQKGLSGSGGLAQTLLPIPQGAHVHVQQRGEFGLAQTDLRAQRFDGDRIDVEFASSFIWVMLSTSSANSFLFIYSLLPILVQSTERPLLRSSQIVLYVLAVDQQQPDLGVCGYVKVDHADATAFATSRR